MISQHQYERVSSSMGPYTQMPGSQMVKQWLRTSLAAHWETTCTSNHFIWLYYSGFVLESVPRPPQNQLTYPLPFHRSTVRPQLGPPRDFFHPNLLTMSFTPCIRTLMDQKIVGGQDPSMWSFQEFYLGTTFDYL